MSSSSLAPIVAALSHKGTIRPADVIGMRLAVFDDAGLSRADAEALMALDECVSAPCADWNLFVVEALADHIVDQEAPRGSVDAAKARWLTSRIGRDATVKPNEVELLVRVLETAASVPAELSRFTFEQIKQSALLRGTRNTVSDHDVDMLRRALVAGGAANGPVIGREEMDVLLDIAAATAGSANAPSWTDLFAKAAVNVVMASSGYRAPSRRIALRRGRWLDQPGASAVPFADRVKAVIGHGILGIYSLSLDVAPSNHWFAECKKRDSRLADIESALNEQVRAEASSLHPTLQPLFEWAA